MGHKRLLLIGLILYPLTGLAQDQWSASELKLLQTLVLTPEVASVAPSWRNPVAGNQAAAEFGERLFADPRLSGNGELSCAHCHQPDNAYQDSLPVAKGRRSLTRNAPSLIGVAQHRWWYWDGRKDSLWSQALEPLEARREMAGSRTDIALLMLRDADYAERYRRTFGAFPTGLALAPASAGPNGGWLARRRWRNANETVRGAVNTVFVNVGQALAAYETTLVHQPTAFDCYVRSLPEADGGGCGFTPSQIRGLRLFIGGRANCVSCHNGPNFSDDGFRNVGTGESDSGRAGANSRLLADEFNCRSPWLGGERDCGHLQRLLAVEVGQLRRGAFRTPTLRNLQNTGPYMHDGRFVSLGAVIEHYQDPPISRRLPHELAPIRQLSRTDAEDLQAFLLSLSP